MWDILFDSGKNLPNFSDLENRIKNGNLRIVPVDSYISRVNFT